jgi:hypothetical protein
MNDAMYDKLVAPFASKRRGDYFEGWHDPDERGTITPFSLGLGGRFTVQKFWADGRPAGDPFDVKNMVVNPALNDVLAVYLAGATQKLTWYLGLVDNAGFTAFAPTDTIGAHAGWAENTQYTAANRPTWVPSAPSGQTITNPTSIVFSMNATAAIKGCFLVSDNAKGGTAGILFATGPFNAVQNMVSGGNLKASYTCPATAT